MSTDDLRALRDSSSKRVELCLARGPLCPTLRHSAVQLDSDDPNLVHVGGARDERVCGVCKHQKQNTERTRCLHRGHRREGSAPDVRISEKMNGRWTVGETCTLPTSCVPSGFTVKERTLLPSIVSLPARVSVLSELRETILNSYRLV